MLHSIRLVFSFLYTLAPGILPTLTLKNLQNPFSNILTILHLQPSSIRQSAKQLQTLPLALRHTYSRLISMEPVKCFTSTVEAQQGNWTLAAEFIYRLQLITGDPSNQLSGNSSKAIFTSVLDALCCASVTDSSRLDSASCSNRGRWDLECNSSSNACVKNGNHNTSVNRT